MTLTVLGIYLLAYTGVILLVPASVLLNSTAPFADATVMIIGSVGASFIAAGAIIATLGTLNVQILVVGQLVRAIALDKLFPQKLAELGKGGTPTLAILISASLASVTASLAFAYSLLVIIGAGAETVFYGFILLMAALPVCVFVKKQA